MTKIVENYMLMDVVGKGQYGEVYKAKHTKSDEYFAVKMLNYQQFVSSKQMQELIINEVQALKKMNHPNILKFYKLLKTQNYIYLVYEFCPNGDLDHLMHQKTRLEEREALHIFKQIVEGFIVIHEYNIVHQDVKPSNILFGEQMQIKIADFGFCKILSSSSQSQNSTSNQVYGSPIYMAPEVLQGAGSNINQDIYALGVLLYEMLYGFCPFEDVELQGLLQKKTRESVKFQDQVALVSSSTKKLILQMMHLNPEQRFFIQDVKAYLQNPSDEVFKKYSDNYSSLHQDHHQFDSHHPDLNFDKAKYEKEALERQSIQHEFGFDINNQKLQQYPQQQQHLNPQQQNNQQQLENKNSFVSSSSGNSINNNNNNTNLNEVSKSNLDSEKIIQNVNEKLLKERNKIIYMSNILCAILDLNLNHNSPKCTYILLLKMKRYYKNINNLFLNNISNNNGWANDEIYQKNNHFIQKNLKITYQEWSKYTQSNDYQSFQQVLCGEDSKLNNDMLKFQELLNKEQLQNFIQIIKNITSSNEEEKFFSEILISYIMQVKNEASTHVDNQNVELGQKLLIHCNNVIDCVYIDNFFDTIIDQKYYNIIQQPYFKLIGGLEYKVLLDLVDSKLRNYV